MPMVSLPAGVSRVDKNSNYTAKEGDTVYVTDHQFKQIKERTTDPERKAVRSGTDSIGTRLGKRCVSCSRLWQIWTTKCHTCGNEDLVTE
jgi:hypothetical protein